MANNPLTGQYTFTVNGTTYNVSITPQSAQQYGHDMGAFLGALAAQATSGTPTSFVLPHQAGAPTGSAAPGSLNLNISNGQIYYAGTNSTWSTIA